MTEPCRALMGYVPGRYVEGAVRVVRLVCRWCEVPIERGESCSELCAKALRRKRKGWRERR